MLINEKFKQTLGLCNKLVKSNKVCFYRLLGPEFLNSSDKGVSLNTPTGVRRAPFTEDIPFCIKGDKRGSTCLSCTSCLSSHLINILLWNIWGCLPCTLTKEGKKEERNEGRREGQKEFYGTYHDSSFPNQNLYLKDILLN